MKHKVRLTVIDKKLYPELQHQYCADPDSGACPCYNVGDVFEFYRDEERDDFWHCGLNTLIHTDADPDTVAGGPKMPFCSELWDAISRYIYTGLQGGSIMKGWMERENEMIACCSDGTRPVIFKIERIDYEEECDFSSPHFSAYSEMASDTFSAEHALDATTEAKDGCPVEAIEAV